MNTELLADFATAAGGQVADLWERVEAGELTETQFLALALAVLTRAGAQATALADLALSAVLTVQTRAVVPAVGLEPRPRPVRAALDGLLAAGATAEAAATLGRAETLAAAQDAYSDGMRAQGVTAWTRVLNGGACDLCQDLAGDVLPAAVDMYHHKGCGCTQQPIT